MRSPHQSAPRRELSEHHSSFASFLDNTSLLVQHDDARWGVGPGGSSAAAALEAASPRSGPSFWSVSWFYGYLLLEYRGRVLLSVT